MADVLRVGDRSPRVAEARVTLARLGLLQNYAGDVSSDTDASLQYSEDDTLFDAPLAQIIKAFQQSRGIIPTGTIDDMTLREMRGASYTLGARRLTLNEEDPLIGDDVAQLQANLQELGFYSSRLDGHFGPNTSEALRNYQLNYGLTVDGECGPETIHALGLLGRRIRGGSAQAIRERENVRAAGPKLAGKRVVIDPALGGRNTGHTVNGRFGPITEEEILWDLASRISDHMKTTGMEVVISRPRMDDPSPKDRADMANAFNADMMISLQCDSYRNDRASGVATFYFGSEIGASSLMGETLSGFIQREIAARTSLVNCGNHARTWEILRLTRMPSVEVVAGYLTNPDDVAALTDPATRDAIAEAIVVAVKRLYLLDDDTQPTGTYRFAELLEAEGR
ncbi:N-acetylmuramoyl-L-alanine amidase [Corynebacterium uberis]|uniref:N-acetylmuramoyl-L-alanine amidase n=1 Tax=Corynebacterium TaxID=1716 RepID=UPI001D0B6558|nr:N-acetylmuramoyl-L-alanine amidase [Corynebacterium uberis]MCZ9310160.1 N-acetylmuramoyl-L-alanine amidase [Corynebacterium sp. c6VSa_13]UDL73300.1 N-acetylmuramoyl-L-alanine amidase [Corynebacterium uberis]UDL75822.1 N-acetylmuramoyl-L-alanine amidase [Corynebacterium uberis]UDL78035.1 N-acetylmuramoyl-L-alanine amidase [Corynebacterium uberis]UDL80317.1 N-acetylmuramoyl-L-alanine amidase [Corynebacterium uberis]